MFKGHVARKGDKYMQFFGGQTLRKNPLGRSWRIWVDNNGSLFYLKAVVCHFPSLLRWTLNYINAINEAVESGNQHLSDKIIPRY